MKFGFQWEITQQLFVEIEADTMEEAYNKWKEGLHAKPDVNDEDMSTSYVEIDDKTFDIRNFEEIHFGDWKGREAR